MKCKNLIFRFFLGFIFVSFSFNMTAKGKSDGGENLTIQIGMQDNIGSSIYQGAKEIQKKLDDLSGGKIKVKIFPASQLGDFKAMAGQTSVGELNMFFSGYPDMSFMVPEFEVIGEPYVLRDYEHAQKVSESDFAKNLYKKLEKKNIKFLDIWYQGKREVTSNRPLKKLDDFAGLKLRTPNVPFLIDFAKAVGAIPSPIAFQEVYLALQSNQVEAQENPLSTINVMKFNEVQKYLAITDHFIATVGLWINTDFYDKLSSQQKEWLKIAVQDGRKVNNKIQYDDEKRLIDQFKSEGITVTYPDKEAIRKRMKPFYEKLDKKYGQGSIESIQNIQ